MTAQGVAVFRRLYWWRLRHIAAAAYRLMLRRWQILILVLLILSPRDMPVRQQLALLGHPVLAMTAPGAWTTACLTWLTLLVLALGWVRVQGEALAGGPAWAHARAQLPAGLARRVDLAVLAVCDLPLFLPFAAALVTLPGATALQRLQQAVAIVVTAALLPLMQWALVQRRRPALLAAALQLVALALLAAGASVLPLLASAAVTTAWLLRPAPLGTRTTAGATAVAADRGRRSAPRWRLPFAAPVWVRLTAFDLRGLVEPGRLMRHLSLVACAALPLLVRDYFVAQGVRPGIVTGGVVLTVVPLLFSVAGLAFELRRMHEPMLPLLASQGVAATLVRRVDLGVLLSLFVLLCVPLLATAWVERRSPVVLVVLPLAGLALLASAALNYRDGRHLVLARAAVCVAAAALSLQMISA
jgi:hypothetical protein